VKKNYLLIKVVFGGVQVLFVNIHFVVYCIDKEVQSIMNRHVVVKQPHLSM
jgi:hypothetical protein